MSRAIPPLEPRAAERVVRAALEEDIPRGDVTGNTLVPADARATAHLVAREPGVAAGIGVFALAMTETDRTLDITMHRADGDAFEPGDRLATVLGRARSILAAERVALNLVQRMSGTATLTAAYVRETEGTRARIVDTRKTTPGLRALERYAVRCGGGFNHRDNLSDAVMAKDNHLSLFGTGDALTAALTQARETLGHTVHFEVEVDRVDQIQAVLAAGVDTIMLDNFSLEDLERGVAQIDGRAIVEASGGVTLDTVRAIAQTGVDVISVGALTHSARAIDLGLDFAADEG